MNTKSIFLIFLILIFSKPIKAGLNKYTFLKEVNGWSIERKVDFQNDQIQCRASIPLYGTWFSSRIRLDKNDQLVIPVNLNNNNLTSDFILETIKVELNECRKAIIFIPQE